MGRGPWDAETARSYKGVGWNSICLRDSRVEMLGERVPAHTDFMREHMGDPAPGRSALDRKRASEATAPPTQANGVDWSKIAAAAPDSRRGENRADQLLNYGEETDGGEGRA